MLAVAIDCGGRVYRYLELPIDISGKTRPYKPINYQFPITNSQIFRIISIAERKFRIKANSKLYFYYKAPHLQNNPEIKIYEQHFPSSPRFQQPRNTKTQLLDKISLRRRRSRPRDYR